jgi:predicted S18 family serine protease
MAGSASLPAGPTTRTVRTETLLVLLLLVSLATNVVLIAALEGHDLDDNVTLTGTIDPDGSVLLEAQAARDTGKSLLLLPGENHRIERTVPVERTISGIGVIERRPESLDARETIEVIFVDDIDDVLASAVRGG